MSPIRIATRRSALALWQAEHVASRLRAAHPQLEVSLVPVVTQGDRIQDRPLAAIGGKGLFIKELEVAMASGEADIAVHSMKDVPADLPAGFVIGAVLERADPRDAFVSARYPGFAALPMGARVGTSSPRRRCLVRALRPDLEVLELRGNVDTRLKRALQGDFDAIVLAAAGLTRLGLAARITEYVDAKQLLPAVGQGVIGIECRDEPGLLARLSPLEHAPTRYRLEAERAFAARLGGSCQSPIAGFATLEGDTLGLEGLVGHPDGTRIFRGRRSGASRAAALIGTALAEELLSAGAAALLDELNAAGG